MSDKEQVCKKIIKIIEELPFFLEHQRINEEGEYRYSYSGDIAKIKDRGLVGTTSFALKLLYTIGIENDDIRVRSAINCIKSFENKKGYIYDPYVYNSQIIKNVFNSIKAKEFDNIFNERYKRAESRQCFSSMFLFDEIPNKIPSNMIMTNDEAIAYLEKFDWRFPWAAGSHMSHLLFFLNIQRKMGILNEKEYIYKRDNIVNWVNEIQKPDTGSWYDKETTIQQKINGAMKVITGFYAAGVTNFNYSKQLIDLCLDNINNSQACDNFNVVYVISKAALNEPNYRKDEIQRFAINKFNDYMKCYHEEQKGFSFYVNKSNVNYYGAKVTHGLNEADMHGTTLFMWGLSIISQLLGIENEVELKEFLT